MPIKDKTDYRAIDQRIQQEIARMERIILRTLKICGEEAVNIAREKVLLIPSRKSYENQTGNLASSIGYVIAVDGKLQVESSFKIVKDGAEGSAEGRSFAKSLVKKFPKGIVLIVVAGKEYAWNLSNRGYDVLDSAEIHAETIVKDILKDLKF